MSQQIDYSLLDRPEILGFIFYPRKDWSPPPAGASDHPVEVGEGVTIACRLYPAGEGSPSILLFHGNGEVVSDHDWIAPAYNRLGISLFVADYRGYGRSSGQPSFCSMAADAPVIFRYFRQLSESLHGGPQFVMGRSLGSFGAAELASQYPEEMKGLIIESGSADPSRLLSRFGLLVSASSLHALESASRERLRRITVPVLVIHGEYDSIVPLSEGVHFHEAVSAEDKRLVVIPGADHNDIMLVGMQQYFSAISQFVFG